MPRPELMAIGDSIYNGVRSLMIDRTLAAWSVPAQVAAAFGWTFVSPDYPRPVLADVEQMFRDPIELLDFHRIAMTNASQWLDGGQWSTQPLFHNLSIAQQVVNDIGTANFADSWTAAKQLLAQGDALPLTQFPVLYQAINTCFVLNPEQTPGDDRTAIDILAEAKPKRLMVNIGINNGLWSLLLLADPDDFQKRLDPTSDMKVLAGRLAEDCPDIEYFYVNLFPKPSAIANLASRMDDDMPSGGYYDKYISRLIGTGGIARAKMKEIDDWVHDTLNPRIKAAFAPLGHRVHFVDLYAQTAAYDWKSRIFTKQILVNHDGTQVLIDNAPLEALPFGGRLDGGMFGLDNLHPSIPGYGVIAEAVCDTIAITEGVVAPTIDLQKCFDADSLLHDLPGTLVFTDFLLDIVGSFIDINSLDATA
ncbi:MAG: hypothetical protein EXR07_06715 [Acetobacteraceae bacterium]|nr:hypothetical protein [Acetobacteraceae bacterium]